MHGDYCRDAGIASDIVLALGYLPQADGAGLPGGGTGMGDRDNIRDGGVVAALIPGVVMSAIPVPVIETTMSPVKVVAQPGADRAANAKGNHAAVVGRGGL